MTAPIALWTAVLKPRVWHFSHHLLGFLEPEVTIGKEVGAVKERGVDMTHRLWRRLTASHSSGPTLTYVCLWALTKCKQVSHIKIDPLYSCHDY